MACGNLALWRIEMKITCIQTDDFNLLQEGEVYTVEKMIVYEGKLYASLMEIPHYSFPQRRFKENLENYK